MRNLIKAIRFNIKITNEGLLLNLNLLLYYCYISFYCDLSKLAIQH